MFEVGDVVRLDKVKFRHLDSVIEAYDKWGPLEVVRVYSVTGMDLRCIKTGESLTGRNISSFKLDEFLTGARKAIKSNEK